jgi:hypothetical protein
VRDANANNSAMPAGLLMIAKPTEALQKQREAAAEVGDSSTSQTSRTV